MNALWWEKPPDREGKGEPRQVVLAMHLRTLGAGTLDEAELDSMESSFPFVCRSLSNCSYETLTSYPAFM